MADAALLTEVLAGLDRRDYYSLPQETDGYASVLDDAPKGRRLGLLLDMGAGTLPAVEVRAAIEAAARRLEDLGGRVEAMKSPHHDDPESAIETYMRARTLAEVRALPQEKRQAVLPQVVDWCQAAEGLSAQELIDAMNRIDRMRQEVIAATKDFDYVLSPVMPMTAYGAEIAYPDAKRAWSHLHFTFPYNQTQQPAISINCGFDGEGLPIGLQIIGQRFDDRGVLALAAAHERVCPLSGRWPQV